MSTVNDGGPAFPMTVEDDRDCAGRFASGYGGMTLRDYFAAKAMNAALSNPAPELIQWNIKDADRREISVEQSIAEWAYGQADAMIAARANGGGKGAV